MTMKQKRTKSNMYTFLLLSAGIVASCTQEVALDNDLPEGKYPMEFSATVSGLTLTRGTADNSKWAGTEKVAVMAGSDVKSYKAAADGALTSTDPLYWQIATETKTVSAWYPYSGSLPATFDVKKDQSGTGYQESDFLYAKPAQLSFSGDKKLTFKHLAAKVTVNLKKDKSLTESAITNATVTFLNQPLTSGNITPSNGAVAQQTAGGTEITPKGITPATGGFLKTVQALLVPQQMKNQQFIKVVAEGNTYYYTPTADDVATLAAGNQYTYQITVKKTGLAVTLSENDEWGNGGDVAVSGKVPDAGYSASDLKVGDYYYSDGMWSDGGYRKYDSGASTALLDIRPVLTDAAGTSRSVVGIVFWVGDITGDDPLLKIDKPGCTHGLVVALQDASAGSFWSTGYEYISNWLSSQGNTYGITTLKTEDKMQGYANTKALAAYNAAKGSGSDLRVLPVDLIGTYATAPANSSGWYCPSVMELQYMCWGQGNGQGVVGKDMLNTQLGKVGGTSFQPSTYYYWSSTEYGDYYAWCVRFYGGDVSNSDKPSRSYGVRAVLAF